MNDDIKNGIDKLDKIVTTFEQLLEYANGVVLELPEFGLNQPFVARLRRASMLKLIENGEIPNELLATAEELFTGKVKPREEKPKEIRFKRFV